MMMSKLKVINSSEVKTDSNCHKKKSFSQKVSTRFKYTKNRSGVVLLSFVVSQVCWYGSGRCVAPPTTFPQAFLDKDAKYEEIQ